MANPPSPPSSLPQARDAHSRWRPHSLFHVHRHRRNHGHHHQHRRVDPPRDAPAPEARSCADPGHPDARTPPGADTRDALPDAAPPPPLPGAPEPVAPVAAADWSPSVSAAPGTGKPLPTPVDPSSTPAAAIPDLPSSNESLATPGVGRGASSSPPGPSDASPPATSVASTSLAPATPSPLSSSCSTFSSSWTVSTPTPQAPGLTSTHSSSTSVVPAIGDARNGTETVINPTSTSSNSTASNASLLQVSALAIPASVSISPSSSVSPDVPLSLAIINKPASSTTASKPSKLALVSASASTLTPASTSTGTSISTEPSSTSLNGGFVATPAANLPPPQAPSNAGTGGGDGGHGGGGGGGELTPQQNIIVGVTSTVSGVAIVAILVLLVLRYRKRRHGGTLLGGDQSGTAASRSVGRRDSGPVAQMSGTSAATAFLARLTGKTSAAPAADSTQGGERGFYRVSGRKLPSVLHAGGDGYTDPRASTMSGSSDYYRGSQAFDPTTAGPSQLALGAPMRPVSGVPIMRSGPARTPVTENPFADPLSPEANQTPSRPPGSRDTPRASASRFLERI